jgi:apolipoprotein N-acyltransferase
VVRAAATGISGVIAPDGTWQTRLGLEQLGIIYGRVGLPLTTVYAHIGPTRIWFALLAIYLICAIVAMRRREEA